MYNNSQLLSEIEKKDLVIQSLQKQLNDNLIFFKKDAFYHQNEKMKSEIFEKNKEFNFLYNKFKEIEKENQELRQNITQLKSQIFTQNLSYETEIEKYKDLNNKNNNEIIKLKNEIEKIKLKPYLTSNDDKSIIFNSNNIIEEITKWINGDFLKLKFNINYLVERSEINFKKLINSLINFQSRIKQILDYETKNKTNEENNLIKDNIDLIKDNLKLKNTLNLKEITIKHLMQELHIKKTQN